MSTPEMTLPGRLREAPGRTLARARSGARLLTARPELLALIVLAAVLDLWALDRNGMANEYYSAAVRSMTESWHAFLYGSFDGAGVMTVDKPPLALWVQALSARAFGLSSWSMLVPQALMGVGTVVLAYDLTRRRFGRAAGGVAGLALALTPITVAISRHNNPDALLVLCATGALWALVRGLEDGRTRWLLLSGALVGLGFEAKMAAALMVVPGIVAAWIWVAPNGRLRAVRQLGGFGLGAAAVGLAWPLLVWLTPAADRPWVSGTSDNSIWSLIFGYNGLGRLFGQSGGPGGGAGGPGGGGGGGMGGNGLFGGDTGALRLLNDALGGQAGWLLGFALVAGAGLLALTRLRRADPRTGWLIAAGGAWLVTAVAFSRAEGIFHPYYVSLLAPFTAVLVGAGVGTVLDRPGALGARSDDPNAAQASPLAARVLGPLMLAGGVATELVVLDRSASDMSWITPLLVAGSLVAAGVLATGAAPRLRNAALAAAVALLLAAPGAWAVQTLGHATSGTFPAGGPASAGIGIGGPGGRPGGRIGPGGPGGMPGRAGGMLPGTGGPGGGGMFGGDTQSLSQAVAYARAHGGGTVAVASQSSAASQILASGSSSPVVALGGFSGRESQVSVSWLADAVAGGRVRWVIATSDGGGMRDGRVGASDVMAIVQEVGKPVPSVDGLYDLQGLASALRAAG